MKHTQPLFNPNNEKLLMIHADDAGLSHAQNQAIIQCLEKGVVNSYSIMTPCPWFYEIAQFAVNNPHYDCGIHLTLTCEWKSYKFGPVLPAHEVPSLVDANGYFHHSRDKVKQQANPEEVEKELRAQIEKARSMGIQPTHLDSHMYTLGLTPELLAIYKQLGRDYNLPIFLDADFLTELGIDVEKHLDASDLCVDDTHIGQYSHFEKGELLNYYDRILNKLKSGFNLLLVHPAYDGQEMQGITINHPNFGAHWRQQDLEYCTSLKTKEKLATHNIRLITWQEIKKQVEQFAEL